MQQFFILNLTGLSILEQLRLEEALLRADTGNWCLINSGSEDAIVMGLSGKVEQLINNNAYQARPVPLIKRFSGGGTVYIDQQTIFVTFIANEKSTQVTCHPHKIMAWTASLYKDFFSPHSFALTENDYTIGDRKCGGNAQYIQKGRWLHHTSFLWDYENAKMDLLKLPPKRPTYRADRSHESFLTKLSLYYKDKETFINALSLYLQKELSAKEVRLEEIMAVLERPHRRATHLILN